MISSHPHLVSDGVAFAVYVDYVKCDCIISSDALSQLSEFGTGEADLVKTFCAYEANINGVARRMIAAGVKGSPVQLGVKHFHRLERSRPA
jgi:hypothetical protein